MNKIKLIKSFAPRSYQQSIFANSINKNTLVVLPTGLGKTIIAIMHFVYVFNNNLNKKILFLAPTKPLVEQQKDSFEGFFENSDDFVFTLLTGLVSPKKRIDLYKNSNFIFSTPQLIENDIVNNIIDINDFSLIIVDEAHRATGNYAYCFIAEEFAKKNAQVLALTASPASTMDGIREVIDNLKIEHIEVKTYQDKDVKPYVNETKINFVEVKLSEEFKFIIEKLNLVYLSRLKFLKELGCFVGKNLATITKRDLLDLQAELRSNIQKQDTSDEVWKAISVSAGLMKLSHGIELFESQDIYATYNYFYEFFKDTKNKTKAVVDLISDIDFRDAFDKIVELKRLNVKHPKLLKLKEIVGKNIIKNPDLKIIIFSQYRESALNIVSELSEIKELNPVLFVGQSKKNGVGISQKDQKLLLDDFRSGKYNILVSTSVGEEGLDIPKVDLVIFYEPVPSAIRTIQRTGRTGRFTKGEVIVLIAKDTKDVIMRHVAKAKERKMYQVLDKIRDEFSENLKVKNEVGLNKFIKSDSSNNDSKNNNPINNGISSSNSNFTGDLNSNKSLVYVDNRENIDLIKELYKLDEILVEAKKLDVADIVISENIAIERKAKIDFVNSILDKRLFSQLKNLALNYKRPILILEGEENLFTLRNLNPNVIRATLSSIAVDFRIPVIYTDNMYETAQIILTIVKRNSKQRKDISLVTNKTSFSDNEEIEKVVSSIPRINVVTAKNILNHFSSIKDLVNASLDDLVKINGVGKIRANFLFDFFKREYKK